MQFNNSNKRLSSVIRFIIVSILFIFMNIGPIQKQVLDPYNNKRYSSLERKILRPWIMFSGNSHNICKISLFDSNDAPVPYTNFLGYKDKTKIPRNFLRAKSREQVSKIVTRICMKNKNKDFYMDAYCSSRKLKKWILITSKENNLCK